MLWFLIALAVAAFIVIGMYNGLVRLRVRVNSAWAAIDVQLKRRWELIPNLTRTVQAAARRPSRRGLAHPPLQNLPAGKA